MSNSLQIAGAVEVCLDAPIFRADTRKVFIKKPSKPAISDSWCLGVFVVSSFCPQPASSELAVRAGLASTGNLQKGVLRRHGSLKGLCLNRSRMFFQASRRPIESPILDSERCSWVAVRYLSLEVLNRSNLFF